MTTSSKTLFCLVTLLVSTGAAHARHSSLDGRIKVHNERQRAVRVLIDGEFAGRVGPGKTKMLRHVPNGVRLLEVEGRRPRGDRMHKVSVPVDGTIGFVVKARRGAAEVVNNSGVRMRVTIDGRRVGTVSPGRRVTTDRMRPGRYELVARPVGHGLPADQVLRRTVHIKAGHTKMVNLGAWHATMEIRNPLDRRAKVFIDGRRVGRLRGGDVLTTARMAPGRHTVELRKRGEVVARSIVRLSPGEFERVRPAVLQGSVRVTNPHHRSVEVSVDGRFRGRIEGESSRVIAGLTPGTHRVTIVDRRGRATEHEVQVRAGRAPTQLTLRSRRGRRGEYVARR